MPKPLVFPPPAGLKNCQVKYHGSETWQNTYDFLVWSYMDSFGDGRKLFQRMVDSNSEIVMHFMTYRYIKPEND